MRLLTALTVALLCVSAASAAPKGYSCAVAPTWDPAIAEWVLHITGSLPNNKAIPYLRIDNSEAWTALHNQKGVIEDFTTRTAAELPSGTHQADLIDYAKSDLTIGQVFVGATCTFTT